MSWATELHSISENFWYNMDLTPLYQAFERAAAKGYKSAWLTGEQMCHLVGVENTLKNKQSIVKKLEVEEIEVSHYTGDQREPADEYTFSWDIQER